MRYEKIFASMFVFSFVSTPTLISHQQDIRGKQFNDACRFKGVRLIIGSGCTRNTQIPAIKDNLAKPYSVPYSISRQMQFSITLGSTYFTLPEGHSGPGGNLYASPTRE